MPKNKGKGGKNRRRGKNENEEKRELIFKEDGQEYAQVSTAGGVGLVAGVGWRGLVVGEGWLAAALERSRLSAAGWGRPGSRGGGSSRRKQLLEEPAAENCQLHQRPPTAPNRSTSDPQVLRMLGNGRLEAQCIDGTKRLCHIRGKMRKKVGGAFSALALHRAWGPSGL
jgi:hypothetical protein